MQFFYTSCQKPKGKNFANSQKQIIWKDRNPGDQNFQQNSKNNDPENRTANNNCSQSQLNKNVNIQKRASNSPKKWNLAQNAQKNKKINQSRSFNNVKINKVLQQFKPKADKISIKQVKKTNFKELKEIRQSNRTVQLFNLSKLRQTPKSTQIQSTPNRIGHKEPQNHKKQNFLSTAKSEYYVNDGLSSIPSSNNWKLSRQIKTSLKQGNVFDNRNTLGNKQHTQYLRKIIRHESQNQNYQKNLQYNENQPALQKNSSQKQLLRNTTGGFVYGNPFRKQWDNQSDGYPSMKSSNNGSPPVNMPNKILNIFKKQRADDAMSSVTSFDNSGKAEVNYAMNFYVPSQQNRLIKVSSATIPIKFATCQNPQYAPSPVTDTLVKAKSMENIPEQENQEKQDLVFPNGLSNFEKFSRRFFKIFDGFQKKIPKNIQMSMKIHFQESPNSKRLLAHPKLDFTGSNELFNEPGTSSTFMRKQQNSPTIPLQRTNSFTSGNITEKHEKQKQKKQILDSQKIQQVSSQEFGSSATLEPKFDKIKVFQQKYKGKKFTSQNPEIKLAESSSLQKTVQKKGGNILSQNYQTKVQKFRPFNSPKRTSQNQDILNEKLQRYSESSVQQLPQNFGQSPRDLRLSHLKSGKSKQKTNTLTLPSPLTPKMTESQCEKDDDLQSQQSNSSIVLYNNKMLNLSPNINEIKPEKITKFLHCDSPTLKIQQIKLGKNVIQGQKLQYIDEAVVGKRGSHTVIRRINQQESIIQPCEQWSPSKPHTMKKAELQKAQMLNRNPDSKLWKINVVESVVDLQQFTKKSKKYNQRID